MLQQSSIKKLQNICTVAENRCIDKSDAEFIKTLVVEIIRAEESAAKAKSEKFNLYDYVEKNKSYRPVMECVYHDGGFKVASDGGVLIAMKESYDPSLEGRMFKKNGEELTDMVYPKWRRVIPTHDTKEWVRVKFHAADFNNWISERRATYKAETSKSIKFDESWQVRTMGSHLTAERYAKLLAAARYFGTDEILIKENDPGAPWIVENENGIAMAMPFWDQSYYIYLDL